MAWNLGHGSRRSLKWVSFVSAVWLMMCVGTQDTFPTYSPFLKKVLNYDELQLDALFGATDTGKNFGLIAGILSFLVPLWVMLTVAAVESVLSFGFLWLVITERITPPPYKLMYIVTWVAGNSITWMNTAAIVVSIQNFPFNRGTVVGILKGVQALSAAIYLLVGKTVLSHDISSFLLLLAFMPAASCLVAVGLLHRVPPVISRKETHEDRKTFTFVYLATVLLGLYFLSYTIASYATTISPHTSTIYVLVLCLFIAATVLAPLRSVIKESCARWLEPHRGHGSLTDPLLMEEIEDNRESEPLVSDKYDDESRWMHEVTQANLSSDISRKSEQEQGQVRRSVVRVPESTTSSGPIERLSGAVENEEAAPITRTPANPKRVLKKLGTHHFTVKDAWGAKEFWLLFFAFFCGMGMSITLHKNLGRVAQALSYQDVNVLATIFTASTFFGRLLGAAVSEFLIRLAAIPRPLSMIVMEVLMVACYVQLARGAPGALVAGTLLAGLTSGIQMTIAIAMASELFGLKFIGMIYNFLLLVYPLASNFFSAIVVQRIFEREAHKLGGFLPSASAPDDDPPCSGPHCFRTIFLTMGAISAIGVGLNLALHLRVRRLYRSWYWHDSLLAHTDDVPSAPILISVH